jgi:protein-tyrosine phosphatase
MASPVDLHSHILPGVDDGALDVRDSVAMARHAAADGIAAICATPHIRRDHDVRIAELPARVAALNEALAGAGLDIRVLTGGEVAEPIVPHLDDDELRACTLGGGGRWILLEPAAGPLGQRTLDTVRTLARRGFATVLAHPERHPSPELLDVLRAIAAEGAVIQLTAQFVVDGSVGALVDAGLVHVLGSDAHSSHGGRRLELAGALAALGEPLAARAISASHAIAAGAPLGGAAS